MIYRKRWEEQCVAAMTQDILRFEDMLKEREISKAEHADLVAQARREWKRAAMEGPDPRDAGIGMASHNTVTYSIGGKRIRVAHPFPIDDTRALPPSSMGGIKYFEEEAPQKTDEKAQAPKRRRDLLLLTMKGQ